MSRDLRDTDDWLAEIAGALRGIEYELEQLNLALRPTVNTDDGSLSDIGFSLDAVDRLT